ncbi:hypothetical protein Tco_0673914 [Tanacetum coccineum]
MMFDHNSSDLAPQRQEMSVENVSSGLVPQGQKASDYDNSDPMPPRQNVVPTAEKIDSSHQGKASSDFRCPTQPTSRFHLSDGREMTLLNGLTEGGDKLRGGLSTVPDLRDDIILGLQNPPVPKSKFASSTISCSRNTADSDARLGFNSFKLLMKNGCYSSADRFRRPRESTPAYNIVPKPDVALELDPEPMQEDRLDQTPGNYMWSACWNQDPKHMDENSHDSPYPKILHQLSRRHWLFLPNQHRSYNNHQHLLPEISPFNRPQLRVARLEQEMSEVKKTDHSADVLASIKSQVPTVVNEYLGTKLDDALLKILERHTADLIEKYSVLPAQSQSRIKNLKRYKVRLSEIKMEQGASGSAQPPPKDDDQSSKKPQESNASASKQHPTLTSTGWQITDTRDAYAESEPEPPQRKTVLVLRLEIPYCSKKSSSEHLKLKVTAPVQISSGPAPSLMNPGYISSGLVQISVSPIPYVPPSTKDYETWKRNPVPQFMAPDHSSSGPVLHEMTSDQIRSDLTPNRQETSVDNISSDLVSNKQKASDYDISGPVPPRKNVVSLADKTDSSQKEIEFLFNHSLKE